MSIGTDYVELKRQLQEEREARERAEAGRRNAEGALSAATERNVELLARAEQAERERDELFAALHEHEAFIGPCVHGRDPWTRCETCSEGNAVAAVVALLRQAEADNAALLERSQRAVQQVDDLVLAGGTSLVERLAALRTTLVGGLPSEDRSHPGAALLEERNTLREQLETTHRQVAEVTRLLDPEVVPDAWGLHAAVQKALEERKRIGAVLDRVDVPSEADEAEKGRACDVAGRVELLATWGERGWREYRTANAEAASLRTGMERAWDALGGGACPGVEAFMSRVQSSLERLRALEEGLARLDRENETWSHGEQCPRSDGEDEEQDPEADECDCSKGAMRKMIADIRAKADALKGGES
jgi:hypothetical protein